jgi:hypothetical protein
MVKCRRRQAGPGTTDDHKGFLAWGDVVAGLEWAQLRAAKPLPHANGPVSDFRVANL